MVVDLLGWAGDKQLAYPGQLAKEVLDKGVRVPLLRTEIYAQIIKQLTQNRNPESTTKYWQMMRLALTHFPPSPELENYLEAWIRAQGSAHYYALQLLHETQFRGAKSVVPTPEEIMVLAGKDYSQTRAAVTKVSLASRRTSVVRSSQFNPFICSCLGCSPA